MPERLAIPTSLPCMPIPLPAWRPTRVTMRVRRRSRTRRSACGRARGDTWAIGNALKNLGKAARVLHIPRGAAAYREAVTLVAEHGDRGQVAECLEGLAHLATVGGAPERAARLRRRRGAARDYGRSDAGL